MIVVISAAAEADLASIASWIGKDNPLRAIAFVQDLRHSFDEILEYPLAYRKTGHLGQFEVRRKIFGNYLIFFQIRKDELHITRVLNGARDYSELFDLDE
jgi:toxin ParE1/3/4